MTPNKSDLFLVKLDAMVLEATAFIAASRALVEKGFDA